MDLAIRSAMRAPPTAQDPEPDTSPPPQGPPPRRRFGLARRLLSPLVAPLAHYARRYLQASVEHELAQARTHLAALSEDFVGVNTRLDRTEQALDALMRRHDRTVDILQGLSAQLSVIQTQGARTADDLIRLPGLFGPRFDELEIKQRPLVPYDADSIAIRMREGYVLAPRSTPAFVTMLANATSRGLEPGTRDVLQRLIQPGMTVADIGANIGLLTLVCAWATGPSGRVIAFEPEAVPRANLLKMIALNGLSWVEVHDQAVGAAAGRLTFHVSDIIGHSSLYALPDDEEARAHTLEVEVVTLDKMVAGKRLDVAKIDVEGAELDVLAGMSATLTRNPDLAIIAEFGPVHVKRVGQTPASWFKAFAKAGFKPYMIDETTGDCAPCTAAGAAQVVSANIAFVRPGGDAERRLLKS